MIGSHHHEALAAQPSERAGESTYRRQGSGSAQIRVERTLVIADVQANLAALEEVLEEPHDSLVCVGDLVGLGPDPAACIRRLALNAVSSHSRGFPPSAAIDEPERIVAAVAHTAPSRPRGLE
jgi:hypothetical protein